MHLRAEVTGKFDPEKSCDGLLYAPLDLPLTHRHTRVYDLEYSGDSDAAETFVRQVLLDPVSQVLQTGEGPAMEGALFRLDYRMKPGALDLEKEAVLGYFRELDAPGFDLDSLTITQRIYLFGPAGTDVPTDRFVRDIVNPAIHTWNVSDGRDCA